MTTVVIVVLSRATAAVSSATSVHVHWLGGADFIFSIEAGGANLAKWCTNLYVTVRCCADLVS